MVGWMDLLQSTQSALMAAAPIISIILIVLGGIVYAFAQTQPPESRGKWVTSAYAMLIGGVILGAITGAADLIRDTAMGLLK